MLAAAMAAVEQFNAGAPLADDITCVVARWLPAPE
jgi:hypothetical protein